jgi:hypothetical protein
MLQQFYFGDGAERRQCEIDLSSFSSLDKLQDSLEKRFAFAARKCGSIRGLD